MGRERWEIADKGVQTVGRSSGGAGRGSTRVIVFVYQRASNGFSSAVVKGMSRADESASYHPSRDLDLVPERKRTGLTRFFAAPFMGGGDLSALLRTNADAEAPGV